MLRFVPSARAGGVALACLVYGCSANDLSAPPGAGGGGTLQCVGANDCPLGSFCNEFGRCVESSTAPGPDGGAAPAPPPETEARIKPPASGLRFVYVAMPELDDVARIDSETLDITTLEVGDRPGELTTADGQDLAVVLNHGSDSATILRTSAAGEDTLTTLSTLPHLNRLEMGPAGMHAIAWFELESADATEIGSFQDVVVLRLAPGDERAVNVSVGFRPHQVVFRDDGAAAYVHTDDGVSVIDLTTDDTAFFAPNRPLAGAALGDDPLVDPTPAEVVIARDGSTAFARFADRALVRAVSLVDGTHVDLPLGTPPTDIDLSAGADKLIAVLRDEQAVVIAPLPASLADPGALVVVDCAPLAVGLAEVAAAGDRAIVFTNASDQKAIGVIDLGAATLDVIALRKSVSSVQISPDDRVALVLHAKAPGDPLPTDDFDTQLDHRHGFSVVDLDSRFAKLELTEARPGAVSFARDGSALYLVVADDARGLRDVDRVDLTSFLVTTFTTSSPPTEIGTVPATGRVYVSQRHDLGRISFIDPASREVRTITGFQLNSQITE